MSGASEVDRKKGAVEAPPTGPDGSPRAARRRGRPPGKQMPVAIEQLRLHHFSFVRAALQGVELRKAWSLYLAFEGGPEDERHFQARLRELQRQIHHAAKSRGIEASAHIVFGQSAGMADTVAGPLPAPPPTVPALPSLDEWILQRCEALGIDEDFQSRAEWLEEYQSEFGLDRAPTAQWASAPDHELGSPARVQVSGLARSSANLPSLAERLQALQRLAQALAIAPSLADPLTAWLTRELAQRLQCAKVDGRAAAVVTVHDLIGFVNRHGHRWWRHVPRLGSQRGGRLLTWLQPLAATLSAPLHETALRPARRLELARLQATPVPFSRSSGFVPLSQLTVPAPLDGRHGTFRTAKPNTLGAETDLQAVRHWLRRFQDSPRTAASYERIVERFYLWCVLCHRKPLSSLVEADFSAYSSFLADPPADWVQHRLTRRSERDWRPLKGPLSANSRKLDFSVIGSLFSALVQVGYLSANALAGIRPSMKLPHVRINVERRLSDAQWRWILRCWDALYATCGPEGQPEVGRVMFPSVDHPDQNQARASALRRTRLVLELGATTGLRLNELATTRMEALREHVIDGGAVWLMSVRGKGGKVREVLVPNAIKALIDQHQRDVGELAAVRERLRAQKPLSAARVPGLVLQRGQETIDRRLEVGDCSTPFSLPLINRLRPPPPRWSADARGVATLGVQPADTAPRDGLIDATALYQSLKRFFRRCSLEARHQANAMELAGIEVASTHWLRHFFASSAAADGVDLVVLRDVLGHVSLQTTSVYVRPESKQLVEGLARLRRRD